MADPIVWEFFGKQYTAREWMAHWTAEQLQTYIGNAGEFSAEARAELQSRQYAIVTAADDYLAKPWLTATFDDVDDARNFMHDTAESWRTTSTPGTTAEFFLHVQTPGKGFQCWSSILSTARRQRWPFEATW